MKRISNTNNQAYLVERDREIERLKSRYDFNSLEGIEAIPVPCEEPNSGSATGRVEYYLRSKCFAEHWDAGHTELAIACLRKAQELMFVSDMAWKRKDFERLPMKLRELGRDDEAEIEEERINHFFESSSQKGPASDAIKAAKQMQTDFIEAKCNGLHCGLCDMYNERVFSISGKSLEFPPVPREFLHPILHKKESF